MLKEQFLRTQSETVLISGGEQIGQEVDLVVLVDPDDLLGDVLRCGADSADCQEDVVVQKVAGEMLDLFWEGRGEHESLSLA